MGIMETPMQPLPSRRSALLAAVATASTAGAAAKARTQPSGALTDVAGIEVGHWTSDRRPTGCTAVLTPGGAVAGVDVRGGGPGTRETDLLRPETSVQKVHGICLAGGSAFGLAAADGVMEFLEEQGVGFRAGRFLVPIVPAAILFDLGLGDGSIRPDRAAGYSAAAAASSDPVEQGSVGAGAGATVGKLLGSGRAMKGGVGSASIRLDGLVVGALAAVNAIGDVVDPRTGEILAGALTADRTELADAARLTRYGLTLRGAAVPSERGATTLGVVAANVNWTQAQATKVAQMAHDGLARAIRPSHLPFDGDTVFALGTGGRTIDWAALGLIGALAADALAEAIVSAVEAAESAGGVPSRRELFPSEE